MELVWTTVGVGVDVSLSWLTGVGDGPIHPSENSEKHNGSQTIVALIIDFCAETAPFRGSEIRLPVCNLSQPCERRTSSALSIQPGVVKDRLTECSEAYRESRLQLH